MSAATLQSKITEAVAAIEAGQTATAITKLQGAKALLLGMPDQTFASAGLTWNRESIDALIADLRKNATAALGVQRTPITYVRTSSDPTSDYA